MIQLTTPVFADIILNHPDVRPTVEQGDGYATARDILADTSNVVYAHEWGIVVFIHKGSGVYEGHIAFMPQGRGAAAIKACQSALDRLFRDHKAQAVTAAVPLQLRAARFLVRRLGFASRGIREDKPVEEFIMEAASWAA